MRHLWIALLLAGCTATALDEGGGVYTVSSEGAQSRPLAQDAVVARSAEICPGGYELLFEDNDWGVLEYKITRRIRCR